MNPALPWSRTWRPAGGGIALALAVELLASLALLSRPWLAGLLIDQALRGAGPTGLLWPGLGLAVTWLARTGLGELRERLLAGAGETAAQGLRARLLALLLAAGGRAPDRTMDAALVAGQAPRLAVEAWSSLLRMSIGGTLLALLHPDLLVAVLPSALLCAVLAWSGRRIGLAAAEALAEAQADLRRRWAEADGAHDRWTPPDWLPWMAGDLAQRTARSAACELRLAVAMGWWQPAMAAAISSGVILLLLQGSSQVASGELSAGGLAAGIFLVFLAVGPLLELSAGAERWASTLAAWRRLAGAAGPTARPAGQRGGAIAWSDLDIAWPDGRTLRLPAGAVAPGGRLLISGPSGAGKSTLLRCLAGRCEPRTGRISDHAGPILIAHDSVLPPWPLAEVLLAVAAGAGSAADIDGIRAEAQRLGLDALISAGDEGYAVRADRLRDTAAGQAAALLTARLSRRALLLDEATSLLEPATAAAALERLCADGTTVVAVAHRRQGLEGWPGLALP